MVFSSSTDEHAVKRHHALTTLIQQEADRRGQLSFARFMELALYTPRLGYYEQHGMSIGRNGDFFTSVSVGPLFGELLACQFANWLGELSAPRPVIVEAGAHDGRLAEDVLTALTVSDPKLAGSLEYAVIEPSPARRRVQHERLSGRFPMVRWFESWTALSLFYDSKGQPLTGMVFANELLDALPVHRLRWSQMHRSWRELFVVAGANGFSLVDGELGTNARAYGNQIRDLLGGRDGPPIWPCIPRELLEVLPDGFTIEICPEAMEWWQQAATALHRGWMLTLDYGLSAEEQFSPQHANGTVRSYHQHRLSDDVLARPGQQDITAHVNFSAIQLAGEREGLRTVFVGRQSEFLISCLRSGCPTEAAQWSADRTRQFQTLTHPDHLGHSFRTLVQSRGISGAQ